MQKKILVLDDDLLVTEILGQIVKNLGHYPVVAHNAPVLASAKIREFDAILLDLWLSDSSAEESLEMIAEQAFRGLIVLISGLDNEALEDACEKGRSLGLRVNGYLRKPVSAESLEALLTDLDY
jgi:CheY-like chemotaxis protein